MERRFDTVAAPRLRVRNPAGLVTIEAAESGETVVELEALGDDEATRTAIEKATVEQRGDTITVELAKQSWGFLGRAPSVAVRIRCPHGSALDCATASSDVSASGRIGEANLKTASGDVRVEHTEGSFEAKTASGDVSLDRADGDASVHTVSGDVRVGVAAGTLSLATVSGDLEVEDAHSELTATSVSGDHRIRSVREGQIRLQSVSGDVEVAVVPGTRVFIDASSTSGDVESELDVTQAPAPGSSSGGREARLRLKSVSGDISIVRGQPATVA